MDRYSLPRAFAFTESDIQRVIQFDSKDGKLAVLRHPDLEKVSQEAVQEALRQLARETEFKPYSIWSRLAGPLKLIPFVERYVTSFARRYLDKKDQIFEGRFCSEVVAMFYHKLKLRLFTSDWMPHQIGPNDFVSDSCLLKAVDDVIVDQTKFTHIQQFLGLGLKQNEVAVKKILTTAHSNNEDARLLTEQSFQMAQAISDLAEAAEASLISSIEVRLIALRKAAERKDDARSITFCHAMESQLQAASAMRLGMSSESGYAYATFPSELTRINFLIIRHTTLRAMRSIRLRCRKSWLARWWFAQQRRNRIAQFKTVWRTGVELLGGPITKKQKLK